MKVYIPAIESKYERDDFATFEIIGAYSTMDAAKEAVNKLYGNIKWFDDPICDDSEAINIHKLRLYPEEQPGGDFENNPFIEEIHIYSHVVDRLDGNNQQ